MSSAAHSETNKTRAESIPGIERATGRNWDDWVEVFESQGACTLPHPKIAIIARAAVPDTLANPGLVGPSNCNRLRAAHGAPGPRSVVDRHVPRERKPHADGRSRRHHRGLGRSKRRSHRSPGARTRGAPPLTH